MECKLIHDTMEVRETVFDATVEQPVEMDCLLPDYCPNVFKVLKCKMVPRITSCRVTGSEVSVEGVTTVFVVYLCEESDRIHAFSQRAPFSRTVTLPASCDDPVTETSLVGEYVNCRGVSSRRLEIRGAVGISLRVSDRREETFAGDAEGSGVQKRQSTVAADGAVLQAAKTFTVREELELPPGSEPAAAILYHSETVRTDDVKVIAGKVIVKGELRLHAAYLSPAEDAGLQTVEYAVPVSQILDVPGVDDRFACAVRFDAAFAELEPKATLEGGSRVLAAEFSIVCTADCVMETEKIFLLDLYATGCGCSPETRRLTLRRTRFLPGTAVMVQTSVDAPDEALSSVDDVWVDVARLSAGRTPRGFSLDGELDVFAVCAAASGTPLAVDKRVEFHEEVELPAENGPSEIGAAAQVRGVSFRLTGDRKIDLRVELDVSAKAVRTISQPVVVDAVFDETQKTAPADRAALTLYFADEGERVWDIAKRYRTSVTAILEENDLDAETLEQGGMLLIPLVE